LGVLVYPSTSSNHANALQRGLVDFPALLARANPGNISGGEVGAVGEGRAGGSLSAFSVASKASNVGQAGGLLHYWLLLAISSPSSLTSTLTLTLREREREREREQDGRDDGND
jgi:hypothetical protein